MLLFQTTTEFRSAMNNVRSIFHCALSFSIYLSISLWPQNTENLLLFAAGNDGENDFNAECTIGSPAIAKNVLAVGATSTGETRLNMDGIHDIDHVASFSSWGFTTDGRIKPEVVAPGDMVSAGKLWCKKCMRVARTLPSTAHSSTN